MTIIAASRKIAGSARIDGDADIRASSIIIGENAVVGKGFSARVAGTLEIGKATIIKNTRILCRNVSIGDNNYIDGLLIEASQNSRSQNCWIGNENMLLHTRINCNDDVRIGNDVGIGQVDIFTHGSWMDTLAGYILNEGPVSIGNHVWLTNRSIVLPGVTVGNNVIIGNGTLVNRNVPDGCFFAGMPGKVVKENVYPPKVTAEQQERLLDGIISDYLETCKGKGISPEVSRHGLDIAYMSPDGTRAVFHTKGRQIEGGTDRYTEDFRDYLRFRGVKFFTDVPFSSISPLDFQALDMRK